MIALVPLAVVFVIDLVCPAVPTFPGKSLGAWVMHVCHSYNGYLDVRLVPLIFPWAIWVVWRRQQHLEDLEDYYLAAKALEKRGRIYTSEEVERELGLWSHQQGFEAAAQAGPRAFAADCSLFKIPHSRDRSPPPIWKISKG